MSSYERREITRVLETDASIFAIKVETRDGSASTQSRWLMITREQVAHLIDAIDPEKS